MHYSRKDLLKHPVVSSLLAYKWGIYGRATFAINLVTYLIYLLFLTLYALLLPHPDHFFCEYTQQCLLCSTTCNYYSLRESV